MTHNDQVISDRRVRPRVRAMWWSTMSSRRNATGTVRALTARVPVDQVGFHDVFDLLFFVFVFLQPEFSHS